MNKRTAILTIGIMLALTLSPMMAVAQTGGKPRNRFVIQDGWGNTPPPMHYNTYVTGSVTVTVFIWEPLAFYNWGNGTWMPWLAESWQVSADELTVTLNLRRNVQWADGATFTAKDVISTWYCGKLVAWWQWEYINSIEAADDYTVVINLKKAWSLWNINMLQTLIIGPYSIYGNWSDAAVQATEAGDQAALTQLSADFANFRPDKFVGTGPFEFVSIAPDALLFKKRTSYWRGIENVKYDEIQRMNTGGVKKEPFFLAGIYDGGGADWTKSTFQAMLLKNQAGENYMYSGSAWHGQCLIFNMRMYPLSLLEVRQAIAYALNRTEMSLAASPDPALSFPVVWPTGLDPTSLPKFISNADLQTYFNKYDCNVAKAVEILEGLGFTKGGDGIYVTPNGTRLEFDLISPPWTDWSISAANVGMQLARIGIKVNVYAMEPVVCTRVPAGDFGLGWFCYTEGGDVVPFSTYNRFFIDWNLPGTGIGLDDIQETPWASSISVKNTTLAVLTEADPVKQAGLIRDLAYVANHYLPFYQMRMKPSASFYNTMVDEWLPPGDPWYEWMTRDVYMPLAYLISTGGVRPKAEQPAGITYVGVWIKTALSAFEGVDGKTYGPYAVKDYAVIPKNDADRLVTAGSATYTPPEAELPSEVVDIITSTGQTVAAMSSAIQGMNTAIQGMNTAMTGMTATVNTLQQAVNSLNSSMTMILAMNAITIILVVVALVMVMRKKA